MAGATRTLRVEIFGDAASLQKALGQSSAAAQTFGGRMQAVGKSMRHTGRTMSLFVTAPLVAAGVASFRMADDFETSMSRVVGLAGKSQSQVDQWSKALLKLGPALGKGPNELAEALYFVASSGVPASKTLSVVEAAAKASAAGLGETAQVADAVTSVMNAYGAANISASKATDILVATVREGKGEASDFAPVIGNVTAFAAKLGVSFDEVGAALAAMTQLGTDAATSSTQLNAVFSQLVKETPKGEKGLKAVGLSYEGLRRELKEKGLLATLETLRGAFKGNVTAMTEVFGNIRALRALFGLIDEDGTRVGDIFKRMGDSAGSLAKAFEAAQQRQGFSVDRMKASLEAAGISIGTIMMPAIARIAEELAKLAISFSNLDPHTKNLILIAAGVAAALGPMLIIVGSLASAFAALIPVVAALLSPIGLVVVAIAALAAGMVAAKFAPEEFSAALVKLGLSVEQADSIVRGLAGAFDFIAAYIGHVAPAVGEHLRNVFRVVGDVIRLVDALIHGEWGKAWDAFKQLALDAARGLWSGFKLLVAPIIGILKGLGVDVKREALEIAIAIVRPFESLPFGLGNKFRDARLAMLKELAPARYEVAKAGIAIAEGLSDALLDDKPATALNRQLLKLSRMLQAKNPQMRKDALSLAHEIRDELPNGFKDLEGKVSPKVLKQLRTALAKADAAADAGLAAMQRIALMMPEGFNGLSARIEAKVSAEVTKGLAAATASAGNKLRGSGPFEFTRHAIAEPYADGASDMKSAKLSEKVSKNVTDEVTKGTEEAKKKLALSGKTLAMILAGSFNDQEAQERVKSAVGSIASTLGTLATAAGAKLAPLRAVVTARLVEAGSAIEQARLAEKMQRQLEALAVRVEAQKARLMAAFGRLSEDALRAFDARTTAGLNAIQTKLDAKLKQIADRLAASLKSIDIAQAAKTPAERALEALDRSEVLRGLQSGIQGAQDAMAAALAEEDPVKRLEAIKAAEEQMRQAQLAITRDRLQQQATAERAAADAKAEADRRRAEQQAARDTTFQQKQAEREQRNYQSQRDRMRRNMELFLEAQQEYLDKHPQRWRQVHKRVMKAFEDEFGPDMKTAGKNLGVGFSQGIDESLGAVGGAAERLAKLIARYLKAKSPTELGPMSDLDVWWADLTKTLVGGVDFGPVERLGTTIGQKLAGSIGTHLAGSIGLAIIGSGIWDSIRDSFAGPEGGGLDLSDLDLSGLDLSGLADVTVVLEQIKVPLDAVTASVNTLIESMAALASKGVLYFKQLLDGLELYVPQSITILQMLLDKVNELREAYLALAGAADKAGDVTGVPQFKLGGVVPGPKGRPTLAVVHGGETILPTGASALSRGGAGVNIYLTVHGSVTSERNLVDTIHRGLAQKSKSGYGPLFTRTPGVAL